MDACFINCCNVDIKLLLDLGYFLYTNSFASASIKRLCLRYPNMNLRNINRLYKIMYKSVDNSYDCSIFIRILYENVNYFILISCEAIDGNIKHDLLITTNVNVLLNKVDLNSLIHLRNDGYAIPEKYMKFPSLFDLSSMTIINNNLPVNDLPITVQNTLKIIYSKLS